MSAFICTLMSAFICTGGGTFLWGRVFRVFAKLVLCPDPLHVWRGSGTLSNISCHMGRGRARIEITNQITEDFIIFAWCKRSYFEQVSHSLFSAVPVDFAAISSICKLDCEYSLRCRKSSSGFKHSLRSTALPHVTIMLSSMLKIVLIMPAIMPQICLLCPN